MALLWLDGFEGYGTGTTGTNQSPTGIMGRRGYVNAAVTPAAPTCQIATGRFGGYCVKVDSSNAAVVTPNLTTNTTLVAGVAVKVDFSQDGTTHQPLLYFRKGTTIGINIRCNLRGQITVYNNTTLLETSTAVVAFPRVWLYVELKVYTHATNGTYEVRVNGQMVANNGGATLDTRPGTNTYSENVFLPYTTTVTRYFDDFYVCDGATGINDFLGNIRVQAVNPNADTATVDFTSSGAGSHYQQVDDGNTCNDVTDYEYSNTSAHTDLFDYSNLSGLTSVEAVQMNLDCANEDATDHSMIQVAKGTAQSNGSAIAIGTTSYTTQRRVMETDADATSWTVSNFNATQFGFKLQ